MNVKIHKDVYDKLFVYAKAASDYKQSEIAGWGHYGGPDMGIYKLAPLLKQTASGAEVDVFPDEILHDQNYDISDMIVQWHSHVDMRVFWSGVDIANIKDALGLFPVLFSIVVNIKGEYKARLDIGKVKTASGYVPLDKPIEIECSLSVYGDDTLYNTVMTEVKSKLKDPPKPVFQTKGAPDGMIYDSTLGCWVSKDYYNSKRTFVEHIPKNGNKKEPEVDQDEMIKHLKDFYTDDDIAELSKLVAILKCVRESIEFTYSGGYIYHLSTGMYLRDAWETTGQIGFYMQGIFLTCDDVAGKFGITDAEIKKASEGVTTDDILKQVLEMEDFYLQ